MNPGKVYLRKFVRQSKYDLKVIEIDLICANPNYALIRYQDGRQCTVSTGDLAPTGRTDLSRLTREAFVEPNSPSVHVATPESKPDMNAAPLNSEHTAENFSLAETDTPNTERSEVEKASVESSPSPDHDMPLDHLLNQEATLRRSSRIRKEPDRFCHSNYD
jgi:hypothetical protein